MGDASSLDSQIEEASQRLDRLQKEMHRHQVSTGTAER